MSLDRRVREGFERESADVDPDVERHLARTVIRGNRRRRLRVAAIATALTGLGVVAIVVGPGVLDRLAPSRDVRPAGRPSPEPAPGPYELIDGTYQVRLSGSEDAAVADAGIAGTWLMALFEDGTISFSAPERAQGFADVTGAPYGYTLSGSRLETDALTPDFCASEGIYRWELGGEPPSELFLSPVKDDCQMRRVLLATKVWFLHQG